MSIVSGTRAGLLNGRKSLLDRGVTNTAVGGMVGSGFGGPARRPSVGASSGASAMPAASGPSSRVGKLSVSEMMGMNQRGGPNMSMVTDPRTGRRFTNAEAAARGPFTVQGWNTRTGGHGYGGFRGGGPISSSGVAGGTPTSQRGRFELAMQENPTLDPDKAWMAADSPSWDQPRPDPFAPNPRYGRMGRPMPRGGDIDLNVTGYADGTKDSGKKPQVAVVGEEGPEAMVLPPHSKVIPLTDSAWGQSAIDDVMGGPADGEVRLDADGNEWRYDASNKRGVMLNPYVGNPNAPSPDSFASSPSERYTDLAMRLDALRQSGFAEGRAAVSRLKGQQVEEQAAREAFLATGKPIVAEEGGGTLYQTPYGNAIVGSNRPRSFTVENFEGGQTTSGDLAAVDRESRADAAERTVRGRTLRDYRSMPGVDPTTIEPPPPSAIDALPTPTLAERPLGQPPSSAERGLGQRPTPRDVIKSPADLGIRVEAPNPEPEDDDSAVAELAPTDNPKKDEVRAVQAASDVVKGILGVAPSKFGFGDVIKLGKDFFDYWFTPGGTSSAREARAEHEKLTDEQKKKFNEELKKAFQEKGYKLSSMKDGYTMTKSNG